MVYVHKIFVFFFLWNRESLLVVRLEVYIGYITKVNVMLELIALDIDLLMLLRSRTPVFFLAISEIIFAFKRIFFISLSTNIFC